jgi:hypothetical protein
VLRDSSKRDTGAVQSLLKCVTAMGEDHGPARMNGAVPDGHEKLYPGRINSGDCRAINAHGIAIELKAIQCSMLLHYIANANA